MRARALPMAAVLLLLLLAVPRVGFSNDELRVTGVIAGIQSWQDTFLLQELGQAGQGRSWTVRVTPATESRRPEDLVARGTQPTLRLLRVGDVVDVEGWIVGAGQLMARAITVRSALPTSGGETERAGREIRLMGSIVDMEARGQGILQVQAQSFVQGLNLWTIRLHPQTEVNGLLHDRGRDTRNGRGHRAALRLLRVGDFVEVEGRFLGNRQILAKEITVRSRPGVSPVPVPFPHPVPFPNPVPFPGQTVILSPQQGAEIATGEFTVIGQTIPVAQVRVEVTARFGVFQLPVANGTVTADNNGFFIFTVRPALRVPGTFYTITVTSTFQGFSTPPVSVTVRQL